VEIQMIDEIIMEDLTGIIPNMEKSSFESKKVLVTGGAGFLGSWMCDALHKLGAEVACLDNLSTGKLENVNHLIGEKNFEFLKQDVVELKTNKKFDYILHLASRASPEEYQQHPNETLLANSVGSLNLLELARQCDATIFYASSSEVYGDAKVVPTPESYWGYVNPIGARSCYDEGKRFGEALFMAYRREYGLDVRIARIFNTYGPRLREDGAYARALSRFIAQALANREITVYGDGSQTRSFSYVSDTITALLLLLKSERAKGEVLNVGNPDEITILELAEEIKGLTKSKSRITFQPLPPDDPKRRCPSIDKAKRILGWEPKVTLKEGLIKTVKWFKK
jgi:UDP-glucuronate decarboxylase